MSDVFRKMKFKVKPEDIKGAVASATHSPVAKCVVRTLGKKLGDVFVWHDCIQIGERCYRAPSIVNEKECSFTGGMAIEPFEFVMSNEPIEPVLQTKKAKKS